MDSFGQVEPTQTLCSFSGLFGMVGRDPTMSLLLPDDCIALLIAAGCLSPTAPPQLTRENKAPPGF